MEALEEWIEREYRYAAKAMLQSISRVDLVKSRPGFGQVVRAARGSIVASPVLADWDPEPDYFFHWFRDSALVVDALRLLFVAGDVGTEALRCLQDFIQFSLSIQNLDGRSLIAAPAWRSNVATDFVQFIRDDAELARVHGDSIAAETRVNPDGTLDISRWTRPQHDGAPLRALALLRWRHALPEIDFNADFAALVRSDLAFTFKRWQEPSFDMWEEERGLHYYSLCVSAAALDAGARWLGEMGEMGEMGEGEPAQAYLKEAAIIRRKLDEFWCEDQAFYRSRLLESGARSAKELDIAVILAAIHAGGQGGAHTACDPRIHATLARLEALFAAAYSINHQRSPDHAPALGRYAGDVYFSGGAYYFSTLAAAELCFRAARRDGVDAAAWLKHGNAFLATMRAFTPATGELSEQFDQRTGVQTSARHLAWSYAAFISCIAARRKCIAR